MTWAINLIVALKFEGRMRTSQYWPVHIRTYVLQRQREVQRTGNIKIWSGIEPIARSLRPWDAGAYFSRGL